MRSVFNGDIDKKAAEAFDFICNKLFNQKTNLIYDSKFDSESDLPTPEEISSGFPNPCGYDTGMEDGMINGATFLSACLARLRTEKDSYSEQLAHRLVAGMQQTAYSAKKPGFLPRAVCPADGKSHYIDSSVDQYTMFAYGAYIYTQSDICTESERIAYADIMRNICQRAKRNITRENKYDMLREDGGESKVSKLWGEENFEFALYCRLPMFYLLTYHLTREICWLEEYKTLRDKAIEGMRPFFPPWHVYVLQQMQCALFVLKNLDEEQNYKKVYDKLMSEVARFALSRTQTIAERLAEKTEFNEQTISFRDRPLCEIPNPAWNGLNQFYTKRGDNNDTFFLMQDAANIVLCAAMGNIALTREAADLYTKTWKKIDYSRHSRCESVHYLCAYYALKKINENETEIND